MEEMALLAGWSIGWKTGAAILIGVVAGVATYALAAIVAPVIIACSAAVVVGIAVGLVANGLLNAGDGPGSGGEEKVELESPGTEQSPDRPDPSPPPDQPISSRNLGFRSVGKAFCCNIELDGEITEIRTNSPAEWEHQVTSYMRDLPRGGIGYRLTIDGGLGETHLENIRRWKEEILGSVADVSAEDM